VKRLANPFCSATALTAITAEWPARQTEIREQRNQQASYGLRAISAASAVSNRGIDRDVRPAML
jgi:hypothetical protein